MAWLNLSVGILEEFADAQSCARLPLEGDAFLFSASDDAWYQYRRSAHECVKCARPSDRPGKSRCSTCARKSRARYRARAAARLCTICGKAQRLTGVLFCAACQERKTKWTRACRCGARIWVDKRVCAACLAPKVVMQKAQPALVCRWVGCGKSFSRDPRATGRPSVYCSPECGKVSRKAYEGRYNREYFKAKRKAASTTDRPHKCP